MGKFKIGDCVRLAKKPFDKYSDLVLNTKFLRRIDGEKLVVIDEADEDGDYYLMSENKGRCYLNEGDIEAWSDA